MKKNEAMECIEFLEEVSKMSELERLEFLTYTTIQLMKEMKFSKSMSVIDWLNNSCPQEHLQLSVKLYGWNILQTTTYLLMELEKEYVINEILNVEITNFTSLNEFDYSVTAF